MERHFDRETYLNKEKYDKAVEKENELKIMFLFTINAVLSELMENNVVVVKKMVKNSVEHILKVFLMEK